MIRLAPVLSIIAAAGSVAAEPHARAVRRTGAVVVDGALDEPVWTSAPHHSGFTQRFPKDGAKAELDTSFAVLYDDEAVYVGVWAHDPEPDRISRLLTRRDVDSPADAILVGIDSYHDKRTAYVFQLNAAGVQRDMVLSDDSQEDWTWDAVWTGDVAMRPDGWTAEFRIPLNQIRFAAHPSQEWGFQVMRVVARTQEQATWSPWPRSGSEIVSKFGVIDGISELRPGRRLELLPYATGGVASTPVEVGDPLNDEVAPAGNLGLDLKYGLGPAFTLSATINPDFGQVEADPSQVNLSANELFFEEKRPFFIEGADLFKLPIGSSNGGIEGAFYSRRIGAAPPVSPDAAYVDAPTAVTIYNAAKLTGKTPSGWSVGVLDAVTAEESARFDDGAGTRGTQIVAPLTNYMVARVKHDLRDGKTAVGASLTSVHRKLGGTGLVDVLHDQAYSGGLQLDHRWANNAWSANLGLVGSYVHGTEMAIGRTQTSQVHLFQRPDAPHVHFDPTRTSITGLGAGWMVGRLGDTKHWRYGIGGDLRTPGLELNDVGFERRADAMTTFYYGEYHDEDPGETLLNYSINGDLFTVNTFEPQLTIIGIEGNANAMFENYWSGHVGFNVNDDRWSPGALRGGPNLRSDPGVNLNVNLNTDNRKPVRVSWGAYGSHNSGSGAFDGGTSLDVTVQARSNIDMSIGPSWQRRNDPMQFVETATDEAGQPHYVHARINQATVGMTVRLNWTFSPRLSLQAYAQPFVATGRYSEYKDVDAPAAPQFDDRFTRLEGGNLRLQDGLFTATSNGTFAFSRPDFAFAALRSNLVVRWEYRPGSTVFAIWSHGQSNVGTDGRFDLGRDLRDLADTRGEDLVMVKANYWIGL